MRSKLITNNKEIPLKDIYCNIDICNNVCQFTIVQIYLNSEPTNIETYYTFPLPANTIVYDFEAESNGKIIKTILKDKQTAKSDYNIAIAQGNTAYYMDQSDDNIFSVCLGNIATCASVKIKIQCLLQLQTETNGKYLRLNIPLTIMPKYSPKNNTTSYSKTTVPYKPYNFTIQGHIYMTDGLISVDSKSVAISMANFSHNSVDLTINPRNLDTDIILTIERQIPASFLITQNMTPITIPLYTYASQVNIIPDYSLIPESNVTEMTYIICLDKSGSMQGQRFHNCIRAAIIFISILPFDSKFNIYAFNNSFESFADSIIQCTAETKQQAIKFLKNIQCCGGTEIYPMLKHIYSILAKNPGTIIFLSDGEVTNINEITSLVRDNRNNNMFTIGIGDNVSQNLIQRMANATVAGKAEFIANDADNLKQKVISQMKRAQESMRKCQKYNKVIIDTEGDYRLVPEIMTLYDGDVNTFYIYSEEPIRGVLYQQLDESGEVIGFVNIAPTNIDIADNIIHRMTGLLLMNELYETDKTMSQIKSMAINNEAEIIELSTALGILSKYTAFIGVEVIKSKNNIILIEIPLQEPQKESSKRNYGTVRLKNMSCKLSGSKKCGRARSKTLTRINERNIDYLFDYFMNEDKLKDSNETVMNIGSMIDNIPNKNMITANTKIYEVKVKLSEYINLSGILSCNKNRILEFANDIKEGDLIRLVLEGENNGIYKVICLGSNFTPWVLEKYFN